MRLSLGLALFAAVWAAGWLARAQEPGAVFHLYLVAHDIGRETDTMSAANGVRRLDAAFAYEDRGAAVGLAASLDVATDQSARHLVVKGKTYRYFSADTEVTIDAGRAHVRDGTRTTDVAIAGQAFFPVDGYAPVGVQEQLIRYWRNRGRPREISSAPAGPIRIQSRADQRLEIGGRTVLLERVAIDGAVWGRETAWIEPGGNLAALTTWAGGLPFEAVREGYQSRFEQFLEEATRDRMMDLDQLAQANPPERQDAFALVGATVVDGTKRASIPDATVIIRADRITAVGPSSQVRVPADVPVVDVRGTTIIAGLWDMHAHASQIDWAPVYLASGVTTIRDMGGEMGFLTAFRDAVPAGEGLGPRMLLAGLVDGPGPAAFGAVWAGTVDEGRQVVRRYRNAGFRQIKIYSLVTPTVVRAIALEAHRLGMTVTGHVPNGMTAEQAVDAGFDQIAHMPLTGEPDSPAVATLLALFVKRHTVIDPTQSWNELLQHAAATPIESFQPGVSRLPLPLARMIGSVPGVAGDPDAARGRLLASLRLVRAAQVAGVRVVAGTDKGVPGFSLQRELELYVDGGMSPLEAIQSATTIPAQVMKLDDSGTVEGGKRADLVVLSGNPLDNISNIRTAKWVVANGKLYDCAKLWASAGFK